MTRSSVAAADDDGSECSLDDHAENRISRPGGFIHYIRCSRALEFAVGVQAFSQKRGKFEDLAKVSALQQRILIRQ